MKKLVYSGKFGGDITTLPHGEHQPGAVRFKEATNIKTFAIVMQLVSLVVTIPLFVFVVVRMMRQAGTVWPFGLLVGALGSIAAMFPHELLHAICFKDTVYLYTNLKQGMLFVTGPETMSKARYIFMSLLPNILFGFAPFIIFCFVPQLIWLGAFGAIGIGAGVGDYYNVFNALTQMPRGARTYLYGFNSYWYMPAE